MNRQDFMVQEFKRVMTSTEDRKALCKQFVQFVKGYGYKITSRKAERIFNMYNGLADLTKHSKRRKFYTSILD